MTIAGPLAAALAAVLVAGAARAEAPAAAFPVPAWLFPGAAATPAERPVPPAARVTLRGSPRAYTRAEIDDLFSVPDWAPRSHAPLPDVVARGRPPAVYACGHCHGPGGEGRPENASLAGLPAPYIEAEVRDLASGARRSASPDPYLPSELMTAVARHATAAEVTAAARYFAAEPPRPRVRVVEGARVPRAEAAGFVWVAAAGGGTEPLGERLLEFAPDFPRHENRDPRLRYVAYVPQGSIGRGRSFVRRGGAAGACVACHGARLKGLGEVPPLAGRSPSYLLRQLVAFRTGARGGDRARAMQAVVAPLSMGEFIDAVAYAASRAP